MTGPMTPDLDWERIGRDLDAHGYATTGRILDDATCDSLIGDFDDEGRYRKRIVMQQHGYGRGEYRYFAYPLPAPVAALRGAFYSPLATVANRWSTALGSEVRYPARSRRCSNAATQRDSCGRRR